ncbi:MAG: hypothetical protein NDP13_00820 [Crenarchaeota archaeon]|nr:hypothetical protein [Thermoproteota archaeon]MCR8453525.1 hypothetical protein [Thermoproteota archaeon]MCR8454832.1 hypothetical protein [Thermoproteota archaeon]MCR8462723.1 hypothetical protein [Thermoproteota archaeon]MCR8470343.1 hypothetical protein [Thermoproteota archaeon]
MLRGVLMKGSNVESAKGKVVNELLKDDVCALLVEDKDSIIYMWIGAKADVKTKFLVSRLAHGVNGKMFGMAAKVSQDAREIQEKLYNRTVDDDLPQEVIREILG